MKGLRNRQLLQNPRHMTDHSEGHRCPDLLMGQHNGVFALLQNALCRSAKKALTQARVAIAAHNQKIGVCIGSLGEKSLGNTLARCRALLKRNGAAVTAEPCGQIYARVGPSGPVITRCAVKDNDCHFVRLCENRQSAVHGANGLGAAIPCHKRAARAQDRGN